MAQVPIACTLAAGDVPVRVEEWRRLLSFVVAREELDGGGRRLTFAGDAAVDAPAVAALAAAEHACCGFFRFAVTIDGRGLALEVRAPDDAREMVDALFG